MKNIIYSAIGTLAKITLGVVIMFAIDNGCSIWGIGITMIATALSISCDEYMLRKIEKKAKP